MDEITNTELSLVIENNEPQIMKKLEDAIKKILVQSAYKGVHYISFRKIK